MIRRLVTGFLALALLGSCGSASDISARASRDLQARVGAIRAAIAAGQPALAEARLRGLEQAVVEWHDRGLLSDGRAQDILVAASDVVDGLSLLPEPSPHPVAVPTEPEEEGEEEDEGEEHGQKKGHDEDHGHGEGDEE